MPMVFNLHFVGERDGLSTRVLRGIEDAEAATAGNKRLVLNICFNYGGRWDIVQAAAKLARDGTLANRRALEPGDGTGTCA